MSKALDLLNLLAAALGNVRTAAGYNTDAGRYVELGPVPRQTGEGYPYLRLHETGAAAETPVPSRPTQKMRVSFVAEGYAQQADARKVFATGHALIADLKKAIFGDELRDMNGAAIATQLESYNILPPEEGSDIVVAQVRGSYTFTDHFNAP